MQWQNKKGNIIQLISNVYCKKNKYQKRKKKNTREDNEWIHASFFFFLQIILWCWGAHPSPQIPGMHTHTHTQLQSSHSSPLASWTTKHTFSPNIMAAFYLPIEDSASSSSLVSDELPKLTVVTQLGDNITSQHKQSITSAAITLKGSASNLSLLNQ